MGEKGTADGDPISNETRSNGEPAMVSGAKGVSFNSLDGSVSSQFDEQLVLPQESPCDGVDGGMQLNRKASGEFAYTTDGLIKEDFLKECISMIRDSEKHCRYFCKECPLERSKNEDIVGSCKGHLVFMTPVGKGWRLCTLEDLPKGAFSSKGEEHSYPVLLDADWGSEVVVKDEDAFCLDATHYGNVARFINHRFFDSNMVEIPVEVETPDQHYYHV
ncbi:probable inactive histone-lysine N-methyltransferase SUVR2 isoform X1 [Olea europaea subsp. europaea]|uniref:Probable inactive histone-lysine N-methyltransferase SUVR2 isoform X1 n=1 Tax=Olea europaea subsp. europaea TaxID=158383 RepID=A0A8S0P7D2_OLEEU|nr:probable inactive histone-lysine N-methyltransferase SUVR2 isoform X1 [Olea europaea subsp. europaea]